MAILFQDNFNGFTGVGLTPAPAAGTLDSDFWQVAGMSFGSTTFGGAFTTDDFARGLITTANPTTGGLYAATLGTGDNALVVQPTGTDFDVGGTLTARIVNTSGAAVTAWTIGYEWVVRNNDARSSTWTFSTSTDGTTYTAVSAGALTTGLAADTSPTFVVTPITLNVTTAPVADGGFFYLRWTHTGSTGSGSRDESGIDDVVVETGAVALPQNVFSIAAADAVKDEGNTGTTPFTFTVTRADPSGSASVTYTVTGINGASPQASTADFGTPLTGLVSFTGSETSKTVTISVVGDVVSEASETFSVTLSAPSGTASIATATASGTITNDDGLAITKIYDIQGATHASTFAGQTVTLQAIVTAIDKDNNAYWLQERTGDGNVATSDALYVFLGTAIPASIVIGNEVRVSGTVTEFVARANDLSLTELVSVTATSLISVNNTLPTAIEIGAIDNPSNNQRKPVTGFMGDSPVTGVFNPATDGIDFWESLEGMRVTLKDTTISGPFRTTFGEITAFANSGPNDSLGTRGVLTLRDLTPGVANPADKIFDFNPEKIQIDDEAGIGTPSVGLDAGDKLGDVTGVVSYGFGTYDVSPTVSNDPVGSPTTLVVTQNTSNIKEITPITASLDRLRIASFNVENLSPLGTVFSTNNGTETTTAAKFTGIARAIIDNLRAPEIISLQEIQDNDGAPNTDGSIVDATTTLRQLIDAIVAQGGPTYKAIDAPPVDDQDGGAPGGNIRVGYLYLESAVSPATVLQATADASISAFPTASRIGHDLNLGDFSATRKSVPIDWLPAAYTPTLGGTFTTVNNHFSSKGGSTATAQTSLTGGNYWDEPFNGSATKREGQAVAVNAYLDGLLSDANPNNDRFLVVGDYNDFQFFPVSNLVTGLIGRTAAGTATTPSLFDVQTPIARSLMEKLPESERYSYNFDGNAQALDHIIASLGFYGDAVFDVVHINSEFSDQISDHDPSVVSILLPRSARLATGGGDLLDQARYTAGFGTTLGTLSGNDHVDGLAGDDTIDAGAGDDTLVGGDGDDVLRGGAGADQYFGGNGIDSVDYGSQGSATAFLVAQNWNSGDATNETFVGVENILGSSVDDKFGGSSAINRLVGGVGNDTLYGHGDGDSLSGGDGEDWLFGNGYGTLAVDGADSLDGGAGNDTLIAAEGADTLQGGTGTDYLFGQDGADVMIGGDGRDLLFGGAGIDRFEYKSLSQGGDHIFDFEAGEVIDLSGLRAELTGLAPNANFAAARAGGFINWVQGGGGDTTTYVVVDSDGTAGPGSAFALIGLVNTVAGSITNDNFIF